VSESSTPRYAPIDTPQQAASRWEDDDLSTFHLEGGIGRTRTTRQSCDGLPVSCAADAANNTRQYEHQQALVHSSFLGRSGLTHS
jgi:hypothetical protein